MTAPVFGGMFGTQARFPTSFPENRVYGPLLQQLSAASTYVICGAFCVHLFVFFLLWVWFRRDLRKIASSLFDFTKGLRNQSLLDSHAHLSDQIEAFLADVNDVLDDPSRKTERTSLLERMRILDEKRRYLDSMTFETVYNMARTMIEAYPLAGVLGTILAIGAALQMPESADASVSVVGGLLGELGKAIWSTAAGLVSAMILMFINSCVEPAFTRLAENRVHIRQTIARVKRELAMSESAAEKS
ncbi:MotA/TolQ/ExbB proton channel family protein [Planctomicrobium sp. SH661]|uniref:MotA/TolQ/ExbB proton channel family protein n=1 Tax=Planctomicrobium sp. SH661 TaxID=3448124 RepID=UPI003F5CA893